ncbi:response regulator [Aciduricibacillus chroicocephali]|uniref:Response regulator n=1 Tax=Aciduricibacillus chroicocephali TaxID=3054939 RepID=A0ABY9KTK2_9BACI|nr:response regulator [Bacillaceae bacterium 44XB]
MAEILVVDDHTGIRLLLQETFTHEGYEVHTASTGQDALNMLQKHTYKLLMLDNQLPIYSGIEVIEQMQILGIYVPTVFMTGMRDGIACEDWLGQVTEAVIEKPFNLQDVCSLARYIIEGGTS